MDAPAARVVWAAEAFEEYKLLSWKIQDVLQDKVAVLRSTPKMYQVETFGRWAGLRRIPLARHRVFYAYWDADNTIYIEAIVHS